MDPEFYRNSLQGRYAPDISSLLSEQAGLTSGLALGTSFPGASSLASAAARSFGPLPGYTGHALHTSSLPESHLQNLATQNPYKSLQVGQATLSDPYAGLRFTSQPGGSVASKPMFTPEVSHQKEVSYSSVIPQNLGQDNSQKGWGLSNFVSQTPNPYGHPTDLSTVDYSSLSHMISSQPSLNPPPAHSSKPTTPSLVLHHPYSGSDYFSSRNTKSPPSQLVYDHRTQPVTPVSTQANLYAFSQSTNYPAKSDVSIYSSANNISYEAVSPAAPDHSNPHSDSYVSLEDLASISSTQQKLEVNNHHSIQKQSAVALDRANKAQSLQKRKSLSQQELYNGQNAQLSQVKPSPQPSPISVGGSPQMQIGSPQTPMPSSTVVQAPPPVQAPADSTTKPKKSRSRKKKEPVNEVKNNTVRQNYRPQAFTSSSEIPQQRPLSNEYMNAQHNYMQNNRNQQQVYSSASLTEAGNNQSPLMTSAVSQPFMKGQTQLNYEKSETQQSMVPSSNPGEHPQMMGFQNSTTSSQAGLVYSVSDALEMSREAVFTNQGLLEGYGGSDMSNFGMQESFTNQLGMDNMRRPEMFNNQEDGVYVNNPYGGQFVSPNSVLNMDISNSNPSNQQSTIDEAAFSSLMTDSFNQDQTDKRLRNGQSDKMPYVPLTVKLEAEQDEDLSHLAQIPSENGNNDNVNNFFSRTSMEHPLPPACPKPVVKNASGGTSFMDSFMSFLQGKKPETLSSMSSAIIHNKPQLPKYIPEPRRPRPVVVPESQIRREMVEFRPSETFRQESDNDYGFKTKNSVISFSDDDEEDSATHKSAVQNAITTLGSNDKVKFTTNKSGGLTMKINLTKVKKAEENARNKLKNKKSPKIKKKHDKSKLFGLTKRGELSSGEEEGPKEVLPHRQQSSRRAKETKCKYRESDDSDLDVMKPIHKHSQDIEEPYDSDNDPVWTPLSLDKKAPGFDGIESSLPSKKKSRSRVKGKSKESRSRKMTDPSSFVPAAKMSKLGEPAVLQIDSSSEEEELDGIPPSVERLQVGEFVMEKKDLKNTESYAIWKIEAGRMLHKFELFCENSRIMHRAIPTFSSWLPNMMYGFIHIRVRSVYKQGDKELVEVLEECRPKSSIDSKLEEKYEEHPLVDAFNVFLQIFLSQALEPGFLSAISEANERFYLDALEKIDCAINLQMTDIDSKVRWRSNFKDAVKFRPHIRELDRPNLKQSCQACEFASQPAIKSVHLFGNPYDRFSLRELPVVGSQGSQEFMIGKTAAKYVKPYHNLYHFKYNLFKRCVAKVNIIRDDSVNDNAAILDQCLQNRAWVLQIFEDLKKLLEKG